MGIAVRLCIHISGNSNPFAFFMYIHISGNSSPFAFFMYIYISGNSSPFACFFAGVPMDIYVVKDGWVVPYLQDAYFDAQLPILPPEVRLVKISWFSHDALVSLHRTEVISMLAIFVAYGPKNCRRK